MSMTSVKSNKRGLIIAFARRFVIHLLRFFGFYRIRHFSTTRIEYVRKRFSAGDKCFFLKVNNETPSSIKCIQQWLETINALHRQYVFICDNRSLKHALLTSCRFPDDAKVSFVKTNRHRLIRFAKKLTFESRAWKRMTAAHMMPFYMTNDSVTFSWHIDADDTFFALETDQMTTVILAVERLLIVGESHAISLDMWASRWKDKHWTFGVACVKNQIDYRPFFQKPNPDWKAESPVPNFDGFFTYLRDIGVHKLNSFYVENAYFIHWGDCMIYPVRWPLSKWSNGKLYLPILNSIFKRADLGTLQIADSALKIDIGLTEEKSDQLLAGLLPGSYL